MLFNEKGERVLNALQSNGERRAITYNVIDGVAHIATVDGLSVVDYPLSDTFAALVNEWIEEHRRNMGNHEDFYLLGAAWT